MDTLGKSMFVIGLTMAVMGGGMFISIVEYGEDSSEVIFDDNTQNSPTWIYLFHGDHTYEVFIEFGTDIEVHLRDENRDNFFDECVSPCYYGGEEIPGHTYEGEVWVSESDVWTLEFDGDGGIIIREISPYQSNDSLVWFMCLMVGIVVLIKGLQRRDLGPHVDDRRDAEHSISIGHHHPEIEPESKHMATIREEEPGVLEELGDSVSEFMKRPFSSADEEDDGKLERFDDHYMK